jgi:hypothetical protein
MEAIPDGKRQNHFTICTLRHIPIIVNSRWPDVISNHDLWEKSSTSWHEQKYKKIELDRTQLENLLAITQEQQLNGIHREPGKEDALEQHGDGQL